MDDYISYIRNWSAAQMEAQKGRFVLWMPVFLGGGIVWYFSLLSEPAAVLLYVLAVLFSVVTFIMAPYRYDRRLLRALWLLLFVLSCVFTGMGLAKWRTDTLATPMLEREFSPVRVEGRVADIDILPEESGYRVLLDKLQIEDLPEDKTPRYVRIKFRGDLAVGPGDYISTLAGLNPPAAPVTPGAFDFQRYAYFKQIGAFGFAYYEPDIIDKAETTQASEFFEGLRQTISARIFSSVETGRAAVLAALTTGERTAITDSDRAALRAAGLAHLLAISGLHVGLVAGILFFAIRFGLALFPKIALFHPIKKYAALTSLLGIAFYTFLVGAPIPTVRALIMTGVILFAVMINRVAISLHTVSLAALVILIFMPEAIMGASFQLSFAAVFALVAFYEATQDIWRKLYRQAGVVRKVALYVAGVSVTTIVATIATAPFVLFHFQQLSLLSLPANIIAMPVMAFVVMPFIVVAFVLMPFGLDMPAWVAAGYGIELITSTSHSIADSDMALWTPPAWPGVAIGLFVISFLWALIWKGHLRVMMLVPLIAGLVVLGQYKQPDILVSSSGKLKAYRDHEGALYLSSWVSERFVGESWGRLSGYPEKEFAKGRDDKPKHWRSLEDMKCDERGCVLSPEGRYTVAFSEHESALRDDCAFADIVIATYPVARGACQADIIIDKFDLWREGAHALWLDKQEYVSVEDKRGHRPWTTSNRR